MQERTDTPLSVRAPHEVIDKLTEYASRMGVSRSKVIVKALTAFVESTECIACGSFNPKEGKHCAVCGEVLYSDYEIKRAISSICIEKDIESVLFMDSERIRKYQDAGLSPKFVPVIDRSGSVTEYYGEFQLFTKDGLALAPVGCKDRLTIEIEELLKALPKIRDVCLQDKEHGLIPDFDN